MNDFLLRSATPADLERIMALEQLGFDAGNREASAVYARRIEVFAEGALLACVGERVVGCFFSEIWADDAHIDAARFALGHDIAERHDALAGRTLYVSSMTLDPLVRGSGMGSRLFGACLDLLCARFTQLRSVVLLVNAAWRPARAIYRAAGFAEVACLPGFFNPTAGCWQDGIVMRKAIRA